jgi:two-component system nitrogen regulation response regulator NtrX
MNDFPCLSYQNCRRGPCGTSVALSSGVRARITPSKTEEVPVSYKLLIIDDDPMMLSAMKGLLQKNGYRVETARSGSEGVEKLRESPNEFGVVILDYRMDGKNGAETAEELLSVQKELFILIHSGDESQQAAVSSWKAGAVTFIEKARGNDYFLGKVREWCSKYEETFLPALSPASISENERLIASIGMAGRSMQLAEIAKKIATYQLDDIDATVLIRGENGTGKELIAQAIHNFSARKQGKFVALNCAAIPENLIESELFGHEKGAFTGASSKQPGKIQAAHKGTLFLDEIGDANLSLQAKLLRVIQSKVFTPVGSNREVEADVRIISATNLNLEEAVRDKAFRQDLYYRLKVISLHIPPLRERPEDIEPLILFYCDAYNRKRNKQKFFLKSVVQILEKYPWPGNVRELEHEVLQLLMLSRDNKITVDDLDTKYVEWVEKSKGGNLALEERLDEIRRQHVITALNTTRSLREAAKRLGIPFTSFRDLVKRYGLAVDPRKEQR